MSEQSGPRSQEAFAHFDRASCSWRTSQQSFELESSSASSVTWPLSATWGRTAAFERATLEPRTDGRVVSSWLPTPEAKLDRAGVDQGRVDRLRSGGADLTTTVVAMLPTPRAGDGKGGAARSPGRSEEANRKAGANLADAVTLLPTPVTTDANGARNATSGRRDGSQHHSGTTLADALLPTPTARDWRGETRPQGRTRASGRVRREGDQALPDAITGLTSASTGPPSSDGPPCLDEEPRSRQWQPIEGTDGAYRLF